MGRTLQRVTIRTFLGLATNGESKNQPLRQISSQEFGAYLSVAKNVHFPAGRLTNEDIGYSEQAPIPSGGGSWDFLGFLNRSDKMRFQFGISEGKFWDQEDMDGTFVQRFLDSGLAATTDSEWSGAQYFDGFHMANGENPPMFWEGGAVNVASWMIKAPTVAPILGFTATGGSIDINQSWQYVYTYVRDDGFESPPSPMSETGPRSSMVNIGITVTRLASHGIDNIKIYRTSDGGATFRFLREEDNTTTLHTDSVLDGDLGLIAIKTDVALDVTTFNFNMVTVSGDRIYVAGIVEDGVNRATRVRWTFPGEPWRFDVFDFTDDIDGEIVAIVGGEFGVYAFTSKTVYLIRDVGNGTHVVDPTDLPGTYHRRSAVYAQGVLAWMSGRSIFALLPGERSVTNISDPPGVGSSIETKLQGLLNRGVAWLSYHGGLRYIILGIAQVESTPDTILAFDVERRAWWEIEYAGVWPVQVTSSSNEEQPNKLLIGQVDGSVIEAFVGQSAGTLVLTTPRSGLLEPKITIGDTNLFTGNRKDFSAIVWSFIPKNQNRMRSEYSLDFAQHMGAIEGSFPSGGTPLSTGPAPGPQVDSFILGVGKLASRVSRRFKQGVHRRGHLVSVSLVGLDSQEMELLGVTIEYQAEP